MKICFLGHAAFLIETAGKRIVTDPYSSQIGYLPIDERADFVTLSHHNPKWHSCLDDIEGEFEVIEGLEILESGARRGEIEFGAALSYEKSPREGPNAMIWLESEGIRVLHLGDCGVLPDDETLEKCGRVDVLLALAGGAPTLALDDLMVLIGKLAPKIVVPMHFGVRGLQMAALGVEALESCWKASRVVRAGSSLEISPQNLPDEMQLQVLSLARLKY